MAKAKKVKTVPSFEALLNFIKANNLNVFNMDSAIEDPKKVTMLWSEHILHAAEHHEDKAVSDEFVNLCAKARFDFQKMFPEEIEPLPETTDSSTEESNDDNRGEASEIEEDLEESLKDDQEPEDGSIASYWRMAKPVATVAAACLIIAIGVNHFKS